MEKCLRKLRWNRHLLVQQRTYLKTLPPCLWHLVLPHLRQREAEKLYLRQNCFHLWTEQTSNGKAVLTVHPYFQIYCCPKDSSRTGRLLIKATSHREFKMNHFSSEMSFKTQEALSYASEHLCIDHPRNDYTRVCSYILGRSSSQRN